MKKILFSSALSISLLASAIPASAQDVAGNAFLNSKSPRVTDPSTRQSHRILAMNEVHVQAARDFARKYANAKDVTWVEGKNGTSVYFVSNGMKMRSSYDKAGKKEYTLKYYSEKSMSPALRHLIKSNYYDYSIDLVTEIERKGGVYHLVKMENEKEYITVKVIDGSIDLFERIQKVK